MSTRPDTFFSASSGPSLPPLGSATARIALGPGARRTRRHDRLPAPDARESSGYGQVSKGQSSRPWDPRCGKATLKTRPILPSFLWSHRFSGILVGVLGLQH